MDGKVGRPIVYREWSAVNHRRGTGQESLPIKA